MSTPRIEPGVLAYITHKSAYGRVVLVLHRAPVGCEFQLPNGRVHMPAGPDEWVIHAQGSPITGPTVNGVITVHYGVCHQRWLKPISDPDDTQDAATDTPADAVAA